MSQTSNDFLNFLKHLKLLSTKSPKFLVNTLSNILSMRLIGNKTHGDLAEVGISEFINQFMYNFRSRHVGKDLFRAKKHEEDIVIEEELTKKTISVSLKAYGNGPLQLSTDKDGILFPTCKELFPNGTKQITDKKKIKSFLNLPVMKNVFSTNILPLIYDEAAKRCNIMVFDFRKALANVSSIQYKNNSERNRKHPVIIFSDTQGNYVFEIRYGGKTANALQRGLWTHTIKAENYFNSISNGWIDYSHNLELVKLVAIALNATPSGHRNANSLLQDDIDLFKGGL